MSDQLLIDLIRHGEPRGGSRYRGHGINDPLSDLGWQQMRHAAGSVNIWDHIITSPLTRCRAFAHWLSAEHEIPVSVDFDLKEIGFGEWEGKTRAEVMADCLDDYNAFYADPPNARPQGAESLEAFQTRVSNAMQGILAHYQQGHVLLVVHAGVIRAIIGWVFNTPLDRLYQLDIPYAGVSRLRMDERGVHLVFHNRETFGN